MKANHCHSASALLLCLVVSVVWARWLLAAKPGLTAVLRLALLWPQKKVNSATQPYISWASTPQHAQYFSAIIVYCQAFRVVFGPVIASSSSSSCQASRQATDKETQSFASLCGWLRPSPGSPLPLGIFFEQEQL